MSVAINPDASKGATEEQTSAQKMLIENSQLIETIAEYQRMGKIEDAVKYQELLHQNLTFLADLVDPQLTAQIQAITAPQPLPLSQQHEPISVNVDQPHQTLGAPSSNPQQYYSPNYPQQRTPRMT
ncbi:unnamed protein product [Bursaphelenchus xylophilus]|uniref:(pine wood nematode) hypothetical protein n=1 Tax=Bursaphelenchus xylophilus TaxID=6326 RepID=A0A7I8XIU1_BURXY|nr:unnamed protein product [Bursaphelenchus xylophilus]CAG9084901.1 unnamed protein product [Bursaphelenchus xylophilus]